MIFFTSDTHYGHANIIKYCNRPFSSVEEMDEAMIANHNKVVGPKDTVYHLGDLAMHRGDAELTKLLRRLNGNKILILGNHDRHLSRTLLKENFGSVHQLLSTVIEGQSVFMCHYPMKTWDKRYHGAISLYGHVHGRLDADYDSVDVGVDSWDYTPVSFEQIMQHIKQKKENQEFYSGGNFAL